MFSHLQGEPEVKRKKTDNIDEWIGKYKWSIILNVIIF